MRAAAEIPGVEGYLAGAQKRTVSRHIDCVIVATACEHLTDPVKAGVDDEECARCPSSAVFFITLN